MSDKTWILRTEEAEHGPMELKTLQLWAAEGRFDGADNLSPDGGLTWVKAADVPELGLEWIIVSPDGEPSPPVHALTLVQPLVAGEIQPDQTIMRHEDGESFQATDVVTSALIAQNDILQTLLGETQKALEEMALLATPGVSTPPDAMPTEEESPEAWQRVTRERDFFEKEAHKWRKFFEDEVERNRLKEGDLSKEVDALRKSEQLSVARANSAEQSRRQAERKLEEMMSGLDSSAKEESSMAVTAARQREMHEQLAHVQSMLQQRSNALEEAIAARDAADSEMQRRTTQYTDQLRREREEASSQRKQLIQLEQNYQQLLTSYREMNERLIRLQSGLGPGIRRGAIPQVSTTPASPEASASPAPDPASPKTKGSERSRLKLR